MNPLAARKQALVAESEIYRQALATELQSLKSSSVRISRNFRFLGLLKPILLVAPVVGSIVGMRSAPRREKQRRSGWRKWWGTALIGWRVYRRATPVISHFISRRRRRAALTGDLGKSPHRRLQPDV
jgi:hypothetical protein